FSAYTLHHLPDLDAALRGIRRLVAPGGHVVLLDAVGWLPRLPAWYFRQEAARLLAANLLLRRLPRGGAVDFYRVSTHPLWLAHCTGDRFLTRRQFRDRYRTVFPGGRIDTFRRTRALHWQAPSTPDADPAR
ncbi:MAG TPA: methyltransferase domain-containing protein, partial [Frankiaceae bacterium]|nr:methyltransferase domain-containing protein [Frankiaceae bacterium]